MMARRLPVQVVDDQLEAGLLQVGRHAAAHGAQPHETHHHVVLGHRFPSSLRVNTRRVTPAANPPYAPATTPSSGARGVVSVFAVKRRSPISNATSVKVPISRPSRMEG